MAAKSAKSYRSDDPPISIAFASMGTKERVSRVHALRTASLAGFTTIPKMTREVRAEIALGRPTINQ